MRAASGLADRDPGADVGRWSLAIAVPAGTPVRLTINT
jgi:hypothetical protein